MYDKIIVLLCLFFALTTQNTEIKIGEKTTFTPTFTKQDFVLKLSSTPITNKYLTFELTPKFDTDKGMFYLSQEVESPSETSFTFKSFDHYGKNKLVLLSSSLVTQKDLYIGVVGVKNAQYEILVYESNEAMIEPDDSFDVQLTSTEPYEIRFKQDTSVNSKKMMFTFYSKDKLSITCENESKEVLNSYKGYKDLPMEEQNKFQLPYMQISFLINEMINLERVSNDGELIKLKEPSTKRKDRYSSLGYAVYISKQLELKLKPKNNNKVDISSLFRFNLQKIR